MRTTYPSTACLRVTLNNEPQRQLTEALSTANAARDTNNMQRLSMQQLAAQAVTTHTGIAVEVEGFSVPVIVIKGQEIDRLERLCLAQGFSIKDKPNPVALCDAIFSASTGKIAAHA